jgi:hypothetical protein
MEHDMVKEEVYMYNDIPLIAPQGFTDMVSNRPNEFKELCNGCGANSRFIDFVPDKLLWLDIKFACHIHDYSWIVCNPTNEEFHKWNRIFFNNMCRLVVSATKSWMLRRLRLFLAKRYYDAVSTFGAYIF